MGCRVLFRKMTKETRSYVARQVETGKEINWHDAIKPSTITNGLRYSLATGNWGVQVRPLLFFVLFFGHV